MSREFSEMIELLSYAGAKQHAHQDEQESKGQHDPGPTGIAIVVVVGDVGTALFDLFTSVEEHLKKTGYRNDRDVVSHFRFKEAPKPPACPAVFVCCETAVSVVDAALTNGRQNNLI